MQLIYRQCFNTNVVVQSFVVQIFSICLINKVSAEIKNVL